MDRPVHAAIQLALTAVGATLQKGRPRRPHNDVGERPAIAVAVIMLGVAKCHERTISLCYGGIHAPRNQDDETAANNRMR
jgi:hypothetical protein